MAVLSVALGIGANTTIFTFINGLLLRPPMVHDPDRLLEVWQHNTTRGKGIGSDMQLSFPEYEYYRDHNSTFSDIGAFTGEAPAVIWNRGLAIRVGDTPAPAGISSRCRHIIRP